MCFKSQNNIIRNNDYVFITERFFAFVCSGSVVKLFKCR